MSVTGVWAMFDRAIRRGERLCERCQTRGLFDDDGKHVLCDIILAEREAGLHGGPLKPPAETAPAPTSPT